MASFQRYSGKPERWRQEQRQGEPGKLFYIIPRHNRANLSVRTHTYTWWNGVKRRGGKLHHPMCFFKVQIGNILGSSLHIDCMEKAPAGFRFTFATFSAMSSNYNNELWRSKGTQTPREISIMSSMHGRDSRTEAGSFMRGWYRAFVPVKFSGRTWCQRWCPLDFYTRLWVLLQQQEQQQRLHPLPSVMQPTERNTNRSLWWHTTTPFRWLCTHTQTHSPIQLFTWPLQTFQRSCSGGKWSSRVPYHSQGWAVYLCLCFRLH